MPHSDVALIECLNLFHLVSHQQQPTRLSVFGHLLPGGRELTTWSSVEFSYSSSARKAPGLDESIVT